MPSHTDSELDTVLSKRAHHLRVLLEQPRPKSELEDTVECSRSTLDRSLRELADVGLAQYENGVWKPTLLGRHSYEIRETYQTSLTQLSEASKLLESLPYGSSLSSAFLMEGEIHTATSSMPDAVLQPLLDFADNDIEVCVASPTLITGFAKQIYERVKHGAIGSLEVVFTQNQREQIRTTFPELINELKCSPDVDVLCSSIPFSYGLWLVDPIKAAVTIFTDRGIQGVCVNEPDTSIEWAKAQYGQVKQEAERIENFREQTSSHTS